MATFYDGRLKGLRVYRKGREVSPAVFRFSQTFPKGEMYSLTDQIRRGPRSGEAHIVHAWGIRRYEKHFVSKLNDSHAEQMGTHHWSTEALDYGYISETDVTQLDSGLEEIGRDVQPHQKPDSFHSPPDFVLRGDATEYFVTTSTGYWLPTTDH